MSVIARPLPSPPIGQGRIPDPMAVDRLLPRFPGRSWREHLARLGPLPLGADHLARSLDAAGLRGRGGAGFPTGRKISTVAAAADRSRLPAVVVANCCEGDPTSGKDRVLIERSPHLVIDGAVVAAMAVGADRVVLAAHEASPTLAALRSAAAERPVNEGDVQVAGIPGRYVASEAHALVRFLNTGDARPTGKLNPVWRAGVDGRPTLVDNAETLAQLALIARFGPVWYASVGTAAEPGTCLVTIGGAVPRPGVVEVPNGAALRDVLACSGAPARGWALLGGLAGRWVDVSAIGGIGFTAAEITAVGAAMGVASITLLAPDNCLLQETARILRHHADAGARQCGPCMFGLPAIAGDMADLAAGDRSALDRLHRRLPVINGRGACGHPDGAVALAASALAAMTGSQSGHLRQHLTSGGCRSAPPVVPLGRSQPP